MGGIKTIQTFTNEILQNDFVSILYDEADTLIIKWKRQISFEERMEIFLWALGYSKENGVTNWLLDDEEIFIITSEERKWIENSWPELAAEGGIRKIAVCLPEHFSSNLLSLKDFTRRAQLNYQRLGVTQHEVFTDYETAFTWLSL